MNRHMTVVGLKALLNACTEEDDEDESIVITVSATTKHSNRNAIKPSSVTPKRQNIQSSKLPRRELEKRVENILTSDPEAIYKLTYREAFFKAKYQSKYRVMLQKPSRSSSRRRTTTYAPRPASHYHTPSDYIDYLQPIAVRPELSTSLQSSNDPRLSLLPIQSSLATGMRVIEHKRQDGIQSAPHNNHAANTTSIHSSGRAESLFTDEARQAIASSSQSHLVGPSIQAFRSAFEISTLGQKPDSEASLLLGATSNSTSHGREDWPFFLTSNLKYEPEASAHEPARLTQCGKADLQKTSQSFLEQQSASQWPSDPALFSSILSDHSIQFSNDKDFPSPLLMPNHHGISMHEVIDGLGETESHKFERNNSFEVKNRNANPWQSEKPSTITNEGQGFHDSYRLSALDMNRGDDAIGLTDEVNSLPSAIPKYTVSSLLPPEDPQIELILNNLFALTPSACRSIDHAIFNPRGRLRSSMSSDQGAAEVSNTSPFDLTAFDLSTNSNELHNQDLLERPSDHYPPLHLYTNGHDASAADSWPS